MCKQSAIQFMSDNMGHLKQMNVLETCVVPFKNRKKTRVLVIIVLLKLIETHVICVETEYKTGHVLCID